MIPKVFYIPLLVTIAIGSALAVYHAGPPVNETVIKSMAQGISFGAAACRTTEETDQ